jgi:excinuclease ABC subunit A
MKHLIIRGAREHNLKNIDLKLPRDKLIVVTGVSGSGKSTLAFDTIYAEGQRRYVESLSAYARQFLGLMNKPDLDSIEGLSPAISIEQKTTSKNPRSTVGTVTEIYDYFRLLYARIGKPYCPEHNILIEKSSAQKISQNIQADFKNAKDSIIILSPIIRQKKGTYEKLFLDLKKEGFSKVRVNNQILRTDEKIILEKYQKHDIDLVIDRLDINDFSRLNEAVERAIIKSDGLVKVIDNINKEKIKIEKSYSSNLSCPKCGLSYEELQPRMFSFNSPFGACEDCSGLGIKMEFDSNLIIPDKEKCIADGAVAIYKNLIDGWRIQYLGAVAKHFGFDIFTPISFLNKEQYNALMYGSNEKIQFNMKMKNGDANWSHNSSWEGIIPQSNRLYHQTESDYRKKELEKFMKIDSCLSCNGKRLKKKVLSVKISNKSIIDLTDFSIKDLILFFDKINLSDKEIEIAKIILKEIKERLNFLNQVGLNYLTLSRNAGTLSGGEAQRIRLATQIGSNLTGVLYILDEPSIGLHQSDNEKLIKTLHRLRDLGNTLIVVEHDEDTIRNADYIVDMGPGAGAKGGYVIAVGTPLEIENNPNSITGLYLSKKKKIPLNQTRRNSSKYITVWGCKQNNLKNVNFKIPIGLLTCLTGVSGSGKSTFVYDILYKAMMKKIYKSKDSPGIHDSITFDDEVDNVIVIDQSPIGKTPRSNPATYTKLFDEIRNLFASTKEAKLKGYNVGRFSFNVKGGRCEHCSGDGLIKIEMNFLPDVYVECEECKGTRYNKETLEIKYKNKSISDVLNLSVDEALDIFLNISSIKNKLLTLQNVGLGYIKLGQASTTLSGGEAQRIKLTKELSKRSTGKTLYLLDEPTTGLHFDDVSKLIKVLNDLVSKGNTMVVIEHNLDVIKSSDWIIDLGPEGGVNGGYIIAEGKPQDIIKNKKSVTGKFLKPLIINK